MESEKKSKWKLLFLLPLILFIIAILYYIIYDVMIKERSMFYLDAYNRGFLTWWIDSENFWGNFVLSIMKSMIIAGWFIAFTPKSSYTTNLTISSYKQQKLNNRIMKFIKIGFILIIILELIFSAYSPGSGRYFDLISIVRDGWYENYICSNALEFILFNLNIYYIFLIIICLKRKIEPNRLNGKSILYFIFSILLFLYYSLKSDWNLTTFFNLNSLLDYLAELMFIFPLLTGLIIGTKLNKNDLNSHNINSINRYWTLHLIIQLSLLIIILVFLLFYFPNCFL